MSSGRGGSVVGAVISVIAVLAVVILVVTLFTVTRFSTQPDQAGLHYTAGPLSDTAFADCIPPSQRVWNGPADDHYAYPAGQRYYSFGQASTDSAATEVNPITTLTGDPLEITTTGVVGFHLETANCDVLRKFHEQIGLSREAYMDGTKTSDGWRNVLDVYLGQALQRSINEASQVTGWQELYNDAAVRVVWENAVKTRLPVYLNQLMGGEYFVIDSVTIQKPTLPEDLLDSIKATQVAEQDKIAQEMRNSTITTELDSIRALVGVLGTDGYLGYKAITEGDIPFYVVPQGTDVIASQPAE